MPRAAKDHFHGLALAHQLRQALRAAVAGDHAEAHFGQAQLGGVAGHAEVAAHGQFQSTAERETVHRSDHGLVHALHMGEELVCPSALKALPSSTLKCANSLMSAPATKALAPLPVMTSTRTFLSRIGLVSAWSSSSMVARFSALSWSGRLMVMMRIVIRVGDEEVGVRHSIWTYDRLRALRLRSVGPERYGQMYPLRTQGQGHEEGRPSLFRVSNHTLPPVPSTMRFTMARPRPMPLLLVVKLGVKMRSLVRLGDAAAVVAHLRDDLLPSVRQQHHVMPAFAAFGDGLHGVLQQVVEHAQQLFAVGADGQGRCSGVCSSVKWMIRRPESGPASGAPPHRPGPGPRLLGAGHLREVAEGFGHAAERIDLLHHACAEALQAFVRIGRCPGSRCVGSAGCPASWA